MTCAHETITGFCFPCYRAERQARFDTLRGVIERALASGQTIVETWPGGRQTGWRYDVSHARTLAVTLTDPASIEHDAFVPGQTVAYVADHLINRAQGFGTTIAPIRH